MGTRGTEPVAAESNGAGSLKWQLAGGVVAAAAWWTVYTHLSVAADWLAFSLLRLTRGSHLGSAVQFFVYEAPKVLLLLVHKLQLLIFRHCGYFLAQLVGNGFVEFYCIFIRNIRRIRILLLFFFVLSEAQISAGKKEDNGKKKE